MSSIMPANGRAPMRTGINPNRPVRAGEKSRAAKAMKWTSLPLPSGAADAASSSQRIATVKTGRHDNDEGDVEIFVHSQRLLVRHA